MTIRDATMWQSKFFDSMGVKIHYLEAGQGEPVIMMHGFSSSAEKQFGSTGVISGLAKYFRVIAIDGRGHGRSERLYDPQQYGPEMGQDLLRLQQHIGAAKAHFVGYSLGAMVLANLICHFPQSFLTCTLGGATGRFNWNSEKQRQLELEAGELAHNSKRSQILRLWPEGNPLPTGEEIARLSYEALKGQDVKALAASRLGGGRLVVRPDQMAAITVPTLGIVGTDDPYDADFHELKAVMPQLEIVRIPGANHSDTTLHPMFLSALVEFLGRHTSQQA
jgi:pimeloyl-ACP methyl ester carboxylesterase